MYYGEELVLPGGVTSTVSVKLPSAGAYAANAVCQTTTYILLPFLLQVTKSMINTHLCTIPLWVQLLLLIML